MNSVSIALSVLIGGMALDARETVDLTGKWTFSFGNEAPRQVDVPHTWNAEDGVDGPKTGRPPGFSVGSSSYRRGVGTYERELPVKPGKDKRYFVRFDGASIVTDVAVNGKPVGRHEGAFGAFCFEITDALKDSGNTITVKTDNTFNKNILPLAGDFTMFGGLYRPVTLIETEQACIVPDFYASPGVLVSQDKVTPQSASVTVTTLVGFRKDGMVDVSTTGYDSSGEPVTKLCMGRTGSLVKVEIRDARGKVVASGEARPLHQPDAAFAAAAGKLPDMAAVTLNVPEPVLWQGRQNPYLYTVTARMFVDGKETDRVEQPLGLRTIGIDPKKGFLLNGKPMQIKGVCRHQDMEGKGWALSKADEEKDMKMILDMGADGLRTAHYPQSGHIYDICDKSGMIVWSEVPAVQMVSDSPEFVKNMKQQAAEMLLQHGNHPSICMWGIFNEIGHLNTAEDRQVDMEAVLKGLKGHVKSLDASRPVVAATNQPGRRSLNEIPDYLAINTYPGWYGGGPDGMRGSIDGYLRGRETLAISEYGHGADVAVHEVPVRQPKPVSSHHPEEWQAYGHERNYNAIRQRPEVWGSFVWNMFDFASSERREGAKHGINDKGLVTYDRQTPKDAYFFYKANWNPEPIAYITSRRFTERKAAETEVKVYTNCDSVTLYVNGRQVGQAVKPDDLCVARWDKVSLDAGENTVKVVARTRGVVVADSCVWRLSR